MVTSRRKVFYRSPTGVLNTGAGGRSARISGSHWLRRGSVGGRLSPDAHAPRHQIPTVLSPDAHGRHQNPRGLTVGFGDSAAASPNAHEKRGPSPDAHVTRYPRSSPDTHGCHQIPTFAPSPDTHGCHQTPTLAPSPDAHERASPNTHSCRPTRLGCHQIPTTGQGLTRSWSFGDAGRGSGWRRISQRGSVRGRIPRSIRVAPQ